MKISQSQVRVDMPKDYSATGIALKDKPAPKAKPAGDSLKDEIAPRKKSPKVKLDAELDIPSFDAKPKKSVSLPASPIRDDYSTLREAALSVQRIKASAQQELEQIRKMRADAIRYQQETATRARSEASQLVLRTRLATQREVEELIREASEEIQKMLADIRVIRITAQEELAAQRKFTDAAKLNSLSLSFKEQLEKTPVKSRKQPVAGR